MDDIKCFIVCDQLKIKIVYNKLLDNAISIFFDGFSSYAGSLIDCTICLDMDDKASSIKEKLVRQITNDIYTCYICRSNAEYLKKDKKARIVFSSDDLIGSTGKPNFNIVYFLLTDVLTRLLIDKGFCAYHASSISLNGNAFIFMGETMSGKTTLSLKIASKGYNYLGDDRVFVKDGQVYSFPKPLHIAHDVRYYFETDYSTERKIGKSYIRFRNYIKEEYIVSSAKLICVFFYLEIKLNCIKLT